MVILIKSIAARDEMEYYAALKAEEKDSTSPLDSGPSSIGSRPGFA
jgi:hypothetical protein